MITRHFSNWSLMTQYICGSNPIFEAFTTLFDRITDLGTTALPLAVILRSKEFVRVIFAFDYEEGTETPLTLRMWDWMPADPAWLQGDEQIYAVSIDKSGKQLRH